MIRTYIVPAVKPFVHPDNPNRDEILKTEGIEPKYINDFVSSWAFGIAPQEIAPLGDGTRQWSRMYFVIICDADDFTFLDAQVDALLFTRTEIVNNSAQFEAIGVALNGINVNSATKVIERRFVQWLKDGADLDFNEVLGALSIHGVSVGDVQSSWDI